MIQEYNYFQKYDSHPSCYSMSIKGPHGPLSIFVHVCHNIIVRISPQCIVKAQLPSVPHSGKKINLPVVRLLLFFLPHLDPTALAPRTHRLVSNQTSCLMRPRFHHSGSDIPATANSKRSVVLNRTQMQLVPNNAER